MWTKQTIARRTTALLAISAALALAASSGGQAAQRRNAAGAKSGDQSWLTFGFDLERTGYNPDEKILGPDNAAHLHLLWRRDLGGAMIAQPVEAAGVKVHGRPTDLIYEGTEHGQFFALRASDGKVVWHRELGAYDNGTCDFIPGGVYGISGAATISMTSPGKGVVYVAGGEGDAYALDLATGAVRPGWPVSVYDPSRQTVYSGLALFHGHLYVTTASHCDKPPYYGAAVEISVASHKIVHRFYPAGRPAGGISGGGIWGPGGVSIDSKNGEVFTATGNALTTPQNYLYSEHVVELSSSLSVLSAVAPKLTGSDADFGSTPVLFRPTGCSETLTASENKDGAMFIYSEGNPLGKGHKQKLQIANVHDSEFVGSPAWDPQTNMLYVSSSSNSSPYKHGLVALRAGARCNLKLAWQRAEGKNYSVTSPPSVANGVVYYGDGPGHTVFAFNARTGKLLWHSSAIHNKIYGAPMVVNGMVVVGSYDQHLDAFGL